MASKEKKQPEKRDESFKSEIMHRLKTQPLLFVGTVLVLVIVIIAFVFVPAMVPDARYGGDLIFGYYNKIPIKYVRDNYFYQVQQSLSQNQQPSPDDPNYLYNIYMIWREAYEAAVIRIAILDEMKQAGYSAPEDVVDREVAKYFQENGRFSTARYRAMDNTSRINLWRQVQEGITVGYYLNDLMDLRSSPQEASFVSSMASPRRSFDLAAFPFYSYPDSEVISYAQANPALFRITRLSRITVYTNEREARQILDMVRNGTYTFEEAARGSSQDMYAERGGDMGIRMAYELIAEIRDEQARESVINLQRGAISDLVSLSSGWAFFRAEEAVQNADTSDPSQRDKIRDYIMENLRGRAEDWLIAEAERFSTLVRENGFDEAVEAAGIYKQSFGPIPVNYGNSALFSSVASAGVPELSIAGANAFFWRAAFSTPLNTPSVPLVIGNNVVVLFPYEETMAEEDEIQMIEMYYPYWMESSLDQMYRYYFLSSEKLDDRFDETFWKIYYPY